MFKLLLAKKPQVNLHGNLKRQTGNDILTDSFIVSSLYYWKFDRECENGKHKTAFPTQNVTKTFKKRPLGPTELWEQK